MTQDTPPNTPGIALVGPGMISEYHLTALRATERAHLKVIVGRRLDAAKALASRFEVPAATTDYAATVLRSDISALIITTPDDTHEALALGALNAGKAVLLQKPMATSTAACRRIIAAAARSGADLQVSFMHRYFEEVQAARRLLAEGAIGTVLSARMRNATPGPDWGGWFFDSGRVPAGVVAQLGVHGIDLLTYLLGPITHVSAKLATLMPVRKLRDGRQLSVANPDSAFATYRMENGAIASHEMSMVEAAGCDRFRLELYGTHGTIWLRSERGPLAIGRRGDTWSTPPLEVRPFGQRQHDRWLDGLTGARAAESTARDALMGMQVMDAIEASANAQSQETKVHETT